jgi:hypothetical protein
VGLGGREDHEDAAAEAAVEQARGLLGRRRAEDVRVDDRDGAALGVHGQRERSAARRALRFTLTV